MSKLDSRTWLGLLVGIAWGLVLARFFKSQDMAGPWLLILLGPPVVFLVCPEHPILSWQTPILTSVVVGTLAWRDPGDSAGSLFGVGFLYWMICSLFSGPWVLVFQRRAQKMREGASGAATAPLSYVGTGLLVLMACAAVIFGFLLTVYPIMASGPSDASSSFYGFLLATAGVALSVGSHRAANKLGAGEPVRQVLDLLLGLAAIFGILIFAMDLFFPTPIDPSQPQLPVHRGNGVWCLLAALEAGAMVMWLNKTNKRLANAEPGAQIPKQI